MDHELRKLVGGVQSEGTSDRCSGESDGLELVSRKWKGTERESPLWWHGCQVAIDRNYQVSPEKLSFHEQYICDALC